MLRKFLLFFIVFFALYHFCNWQTEGFSERRIKSDLPYHSAWEVQNRYSEEIFNQPYHYLGHGAQMYAFYSEDGKYIIKFHQHHRSKHPLQGISFLLPPPLKKRLLQTVEKRERKRLKDFSSYVLAFEKLPEETGLLYFHLNKTANMKKKLTIYDKIHVKHILDLDNYSFVVQKRGNLFYPTVEKWITEGAWQTAENALSELVALIIARCQKQIFDKDPDLITNFGFVDNHPIQFDIGRFKIDPSRADANVYSDELIRITDQLCLWLDKKAPRLSQHIRKEIAKKA